VHRATSHSEGTNRSRSSSCGTSFLRRSLKALTTPSTVPSSCGASAKLNQLSALHTATDSDSGNIKDDSIFLNNQYFTRYYDGSFRGKITKHKIQGIYVNSKTKKSLPLLVKK
jgi:hypothetical protein